MTIPLALPARADDPDARLVRGLGVKQLAANIFNYTVGSGIFVLPALVVAQLGAAAPLAYLLCAFVIGMVVLVMAQAGSRVEMTGGPYAYVRVAFGPFTGFIAGALSAINEMSSAAAVVSVLGASLARLFGLGGAGWNAFFITALVVGLGLLNVRGLKWGARVIAFCTGVKIFPLLFFVALGAFFILPANLHWATTPTLGAVAATSGTLFFAFAGLEGALLPSGETRDPSRTVPRALMLGLGVATLLYLAIQTVALGIMGPALATDTVAPLSTAAGTFAGRFGATLLLAGASISMFGWLTGSILAGPRILFALGRDGLLPRALCDVHERFRTPWIAIGAYALVMLILALSGTFVQLIIIANLGALGLYFMCAVAAWALRRRDVRGSGEPFSIPGGALVPVLACLSITLIVVKTIGRTEFIAFGILFAATALLYVLRRNQVTAAT